jgi:hypothetical protein
MLADKFICMFVCIHCTLMNKKPLLGFIRIACKCQWDKRPLSATCRKCRCCFVCSRMVNGPAVQRALKWLAPWKYGPACGLWKPVVRRDYKTIEKRLSVAPCLSFRLSVRDSVFPSVRLEKLGCLSGRRIWMKFDIPGFFENLPRKFRFH